MKSPPIARFNSFCFIFKYSFILIHVNSDLRISRLVFVDATEHMISPQLIRFNFGTLNSSSNFREAFVCLSFFIGVLRHIFL